MASGATSRQMKNGKTDWNSNGHLVSYTFPNANVCCCSCCLPFSCLSTFLEMSSQPHLDLVSALPEGGEYSTFSYADSWLQAAVTPGIENLNLMLHKKYNFPCSPFLSDGVRKSIRDLQLHTCVFRPTSELGPLRRLTSLDLNSVRITGDELECLLFNSLALERLDLKCCKEIIFQKIPCVLQQLSHLTVDDCYRLQVIECKAPNLSFMEYSGEKIILSLVHSLKMKRLNMHHPDVICYACAELPSIMPNLETLEIGSHIEVVNTPMLLTKFQYLKHLTIQIGVRAFPPPFDYFSLVSFVVSSPSLETLLLEAAQDGVNHESVFGSSSHLRQLPEHQHNCLKIVEIRGFSSAKSLVELTCCIVNNAASLERLTLDILRYPERCSGKANITCWPISNAALEDASRMVAAIKM
ncbi:uncharacterized protein C2845_PM03G34580 [Panicum miliaceum]|uniref:At1g61320/AtMIF1 LRR domain-containing protein n=1 Tax=Panicum miliaceum TaxID=4540 RepID=A0A3L6T9U3_PANMI|nr:uncharacterized protein C2845_PM03G34580 [Panicum miliaceum]